MKIVIAGLAFAAGVLAQQPGRAGRGAPSPLAEPADFADTTGWTPMFDGQGLRGWDGNFDLWHVENGAIVAESTCEKPSGTAYLIWQGGEPGDFELKAELKVEGPAVASGIQYRSVMQPPNTRGGGANFVRGEGPAGGRGGRVGGRGASAPCSSGLPRGAADPAAEAKWNLVGPRLDFDGSNRDSGQYFESGTQRGILAWRGQMVRTGEGRKPELLASLGDRDELARYIKAGDWNQIHIIARGNELIHIVNGHVMCILIDGDAKFRKSGSVGLLIEGTGKVNFRSLSIKMAQ